MYNRAAGGWAKHWDFMLIDILCLQIAYILAYSIWFGINRLVFEDDNYRGLSILLVAFNILVAILLNTMHSVLKRNIFEEIKQTVKQTLAVIAGVMVYIFSLNESNRIDPIVLYITLGIYIVLSLLTRLLYKSILIKHKRNTKNREMLIVGDEAGINKALEAFDKMPEEGIRVSGAVLVQNESSLTSIKDTDGTDIPVVAILENAGEYILNKWIDEVYIAVQNYTLMPEKLIEQCSEMAVTVHQQMFTYDTVAGRQWVEKIAKQPVLTTSIRIPKPRTMIAKRIIDIVAGFFMSISALIVLLFIAPIIKLKSHGPILIRQERIGQNGKRFHCYIIRTMYLDAESRLKNWQGTLTPKTDPRIIGNKNGKTGIGYLIRKSGLDDLPRAFNVLLGSMSLVGTRAPSPEEWDRYEFRHRARLACKPGVTGLWQASGRSRSMSFEEATKLDTEYIANWSLSLDLKIVLKTLFVKHK